GGGGERCIICNDGEEPVCACEQVGAAWEVMKAFTKDLWSLVLDQIYVDPADLAGAIQEEATLEPLDYRTRLLIRDGVEALRSYWGTSRFEDWLAQCPVRNKIEVIRRENFDRQGFPFLEEQLVEPTR